LVVAGCAPLIPATVPPQLSHTPGTFITIDDQFVGTAVWRIRYPDGWRVVKISIAAEPVRLVFVSPDEHMLIEVAETTPLEATPEPDRINFRDTLSIAGITLYLGGSTPQDEREIFEGFYQLVRDSVQIR
jgi:hypothetical protein